MLTAVAVFVTVVVMVFAGIFATTGNFPPRTTVVESQSMQHGIGSQIGTIDTADMVILREKDQGPIKSYVDGYVSGYKSFGSYGDVIVYSRGDGQNPVIHRAILWLYYNGDRTWSAPSLKDYPAELWACTGSTDYNRLSGTLTLMGLVHYIGSDNDPPSLDLDQLVKKNSDSGFITMGDNNPTFDQPSRISGVDGLISDSQIQTVAWMEVPWAGVFRMVFISGKLSVVDEMVPNTIPCLIAAVLLIIFILIGVSFLFDYFYYQKYRRELDKEMNALPPSFLVERRRR
ncbi:MAG: S26 family signal peptidase [Candidatus Methanoplasma sp.]|jgi:signal peptidase|nr:S26 family signal peptidase [Candidatus Methanoplasma sp.]